MKLSTETLEAGYGVLFDQRVRVAHRACLEHARLDREDGWPTIMSCLAFAELFGVPGAELAAFFGYLGYNDGGRTVWVDAMGGPVPTYTARDRATREQSIAFGFLCAFQDAVAQEAQR